MKFSDSALTSSVKAIGQSASLKDLTLSLIHSKIKDEGAQALLDGFAELKSKLTSVNLVLISNGFTNNSKPIFAKLLPIFSSAESLYLSLHANKIGAEGAEGVSQGLSELTNLKYLNLDLYFNNITDVGVAALSGSIKKMTKLHTLKWNLDFNNILNEGGQWIKEAISPLTQLTTLHLGVATKNFGNSGFEAVTQAL